MMTADTTPAGGPPTACYGPFTQIGCALDDGVLTLSLARPEKQNAMGIEMVLELERALDAIANDERVRVVVLEGRGAHFCSGMDMRDFFQDDAHLSERVAQARKKVERLRAGQLRDLPQPVIAAVRGNCLGAAITLVESCDIVLAADDAVFGFPEINFGFFFGGAIAKAALSLMPRRAAVYHGLTGDVFDAAEAVRLGVATRCVAADLLVQEAARLAHRLAAKDAFALALSKESIRSVPDMAWDVAGQHAAGKVAQLARLQSGPGGRAEKVRDFLKGGFKPGHGDDAQAQPAAPARADDSNRGDTQ